MDAERGFPDTRGAPAASNRRIFALMSPPKIDRALPCDRQSMDSHTNTSERTAQLDGPPLHRALGVRDLVLFNIAAIVGLRWLSVAAQIGPSSLVLWVVALLIFFLPLSLTASELSSRLPGEGGLYLWSKAAFGEMHGFVCGWSFWAANVVFFPSLLLFLAGVSVYIAGDRFLPLAGSNLYNAVYCLVALWGVTLLKVIGVQRAKWLQNFGGIATWLVAVLIIVAAGWAWYQFGSSTVFARSNVMPDFGSMKTLALIAIIAFAFDGFELAPVLAGEIVEPRRTMPRAIALSGMAIAAIYILGTLGLLIALPSGKIDIIAGIPQALSAVGQRVGLPQFGAVAAALLTLSQLGGLGAWVMATARLPFVVGVDRYFPKAIARLHPKYQTPHIALITQAVLVSLMLWAALSSSTIHETYLILVDMTVILTFVPLLYIFAALPVLRRRASGNDAGVVLVPGGALGCWLASILGFSTTVLAIGFAMVPPEHTANPTLFFLKVGGGCLLLIGIGLVFYVHGRNSRGAQAA